MTFVLISILPAALIVAAMTDIVSFKIPNLISVLLLSMFPVAALSAGADLTLITQGFGLGAVALVIGFAFFAVGKVGGGDVKLLAAATPWFGLAAGAEFLLMTGICGGLLAMLLLAYRSLPMTPVTTRFGWLYQLYENQKYIPYGVAIAAGGLFAYPQSTIFKLAIGG